MQPLVWSQVDLEESALDAGCDNDNRDMSAALCCTHRNVPSSAADDGYTKSTECGVDQPGSVLDVIFSRLGRFTYTVSK
jgi:hypothetical protein